jgi:transcriptional regulator with XRE-family HTH domain
MAARNELDPRAMLGELLRLARQQGPHRTQDDLAHAIDLERTGISRAESGDRVPTPATLGEWLTACEVSGLPETAIRMMHKLARAMEDPATVEVEPWFDAEARAHSLKYWAPTILPGIMQTEAYARELFNAMRLDAATVEDYLRTRLRRQSILTRPDAPDVVIVIWQPVLMHQIGTSEIMRDALARLVEVSQFPTVAVHVLPSSLGANPGLGGAVNLAATDDAPELLLSDALVTDQLSREPAVVRKARATFGAVRADALNRADSRALIREAQGIWRA